MNATARWACVCLILSTTVLNEAKAQPTPRPNTFFLQSNQAGSTTDLDNLSVIDLDTGNVVYTNAFEVGTDSTNRLDLYYWPQGYSDTTNFVLNGSMTRIVNGRLRLETTGFGANGSGGYESHSEAVYRPLLPHNFKVEFDAVRLQWAGHFHFHVYYRAPTDSRAPYETGGTYSSNRAPALRLDVMRMAASGSWFQQYGVITNIGWPGGSGGAWAASFPAPAGSLLSNHRLGISLSNSIARFHLDGVVLSSLDISPWIATERIKLVRFVQPAFENLQLGGLYQLQASPDGGVWSNAGSPFSATNQTMSSPGYWPVSNWNSLFFRLQRQ